MDKGTFRVDILGPLRIQSAGQVIRIGPPKQRLLLAVLTLNRGHSVGAQQLIDTVWGEDPPQSATKTIQTYISGLRRLLPEQTLQTVHRGYELVLDPEDFDADVFEACIRAARALREAGQLKAAVGALEEGLALWRGPVLNDLPGEIKEIAAVPRLEELRRVAIEDLHGIRMERGGDSELVADLDAAVSEEPLRERRWAQLMTSLYRSGRQADALRAYKRLSEYLGTELGIEPSADLTQLEQAILLQDPALCQSGSVLVDDQDPSSLDLGAGTYAPSLNQIEPPFARHSLLDGELTIGRHVDNGVVLPTDRRVSRRHAEIRTQDGEWIIRDLRSRNGTTLNGKSITESVLRTGDQIKIGGCAFVFLVEDDSKETLTGTWKPDG